MAPINAAKLTYFNGRGRAEICRWTLAQAGVEFEDYRLKEGEWATVKPSKYYKYNLAINFDSVFCIFGMEHSENCLWQ